MKKKLKSFLCTVFSLMLIFISGCGNNEEASSKKAVKKNYDIFIYNTDSKLAEKFQDMCEEYRERTGIIVKSITAKDNENPQELLEEYMNSDTPPDIFMIDSLSELKKWQETQNTWDFNNATEEDFKKMVNSIPEGMRLGTNAADSFGYPCSVETSGLIMDPKMASALCGGDLHRNFIDDMGECTFEEFKQFVNSAKSYIFGGGSYEFSLNGKNYKFLNNKNELSQNLNGVFSFAAGNTAFTGSYLTNTALTSIWNSMGAANISTADEIKNLETPLRGLVEVMDLITSNIGGKNGILTRSAELTSNTSNGTNQAIKDFVGGKSIFLFGTTQDYENLNIYSTDVARRCIFIPVKMPIIQDTIKANARTEKDFRNSISIHIPHYYVINAQSADREKKLSQNFLMWLHTSDLAEKYLISEFGYVPFDMEEGSSSVLDNTLSRSMVNYISSNHYLPYVSPGAPDSWCDEAVGKYIVEQYYTKGVWSYDDYTRLADYEVKKWLEIAKK